MDVQDVIKTIGEGFKSVAKTETVFGEPLQVDGKTIVPVAKVSYGFGAGGGVSELAPGGAGEGEAPKKASGSGGGGGGGIQVQPVGYLTTAANEEVVFVPFYSRKGLLIALAGGLVLGLMIGRKMRAKA